MLDWDGKKRVSHKQVAGFADSAFIVEGDKKTNRVGKRRKLEDILTPKKVYQNRKSLKYLKTISQSFIISCFNGKKILQTIVPFTKSTHFFFLII